MKGGKQLSGYSITVTGVTKWRKKAGDGRVVEVGAGNSSSLTSESNESIVIKIAEKSYARDLSSRFGCTLSSFSLPPALSVRSLSP